MLKVLWSKLTAIRNYPRVREAGRGVVAKHEKSLAAVRLLGELESENKKAVLKAHRAWMTQAILDELKRIDVKGLARYGADVGGLARKGFLSVYEVLMAGDDGSSSTGVNATESMLRQRTGMSVGTCRAALTAIGNLVPVLEASLRVRIDPDRVSKSEMALLESVARYVNTRKDLPASLAKVQAGVTDLQLGLDWIKSKLNSTELRHDMAEQDQFIGYIKAYEPHIEKLVVACEVERRVLCWLPVEGAGSAVKRFSENSAWFYAALEGLIPLTAPKAGTKQPPVSPAPPTQPGLGAGSSPEAEKDTEESIPYAPRIRRPRGSGGQTPPSPPKETIDPLEQIHFEPLPDGSSDADHGRVPLEVATAVESLELQRGKLTADLRRYQLFGAQFMIQQQRALLGDDMGLGKTVQALAAMCHLDALGKRHFLVVVPNSVLINWEREVRAHTGLTPHILHGGFRFSSLALWKQNGGVAITTYGTLGMMLPSIDKIDMLTVDEAHKVKNPKRKQTILIRTATEKAEFVSLMSGTALENRLSELFDLVCLARPSIRDTARYLLSSERPSPDEARRRIAAAYLRRTREDVLSELPEMTKVDEFVTLTRAELDSEEAKKEHIQNQRIAATIGTGEGESSKYDRLDELLEFYRSNRDKVVIFSAFRKVLEDVSLICGGCEQITGDVPAAERMRMIDRFKAKEGFSCLALQIEAGGQGLNLQFARVAILMEPQYKPSTENQAIARLQRMGQSRKVIVHRMIAKDSVDEDLVQLIAKKQEIFDDYAHQSAVKDESGMAIDSSSVQQEIADELQRRADERRRRRAEAG